MNTTRDAFRAERRDPVPRIIVERHADDRATSITTELSPDKIAERYGGGIARRIFERAESIRFNYFVARPA
jgi:hypothetical protein